MKLTKKLKQEAQIEANRLGHAIIIGLPIWASRNQHAQLYDTGGIRKCFKKWSKDYNILSVIWPS